MKVEVVVPEDYMGDVMGDLSSRRGRIIGIEAQGHLQECALLHRVVEALLWSFLTMRKFHPKTIIESRGKLRRSEE